MTLKKKVILVLSITLFFIILSLSGMGLYLYYHPEQIKPIIEKSLSASTGLSCTIENLSYTFRPMTLEAKNILFASVRQQETFSVETRLVKADVAVDGPFGHRSLVFKNIQIDGLYLELFSEHSTFPVLAIPGKESRSFLSKILRSLVGFLLFQDIRFQSGGIIDGNISALISGYTIKVNRILAKTGSNEPLFLSFALEVRSSSHKLHVKAPSVTIHTNEVFNIVNLKLSGALQSDGMTFQSPELGVRRMDVLARFAYTHPHKKLAVENLKVSCENITLRTDSKKTVSCPVSATAAETISMETGFIHDINEGEIKFAPLEIQISRISLREKTGRPLPPLDIHLKTEPVFNLHTYQFDFPKLHLAFSDTANLEGAFLVGFGHKRTIELQISNASLLSERRSYFLPSEVGQFLKHLKLKGVVFFKGFFSGINQDEKWRWDCDLELRLSKNPYDYFDGTSQLKGLVSAVINAKGSFPDVVVSAQIDGDHNILITKALALEPFKTNLFLSMQYPLIDIKDVIIQIPQARISAANRDILIKEIRVHIPNGRADGEKRFIALPEARFDSSILKNLLFTGHLQKNKITLLLKGQETSLLHAASACRLLPPDPVFTARDSIHLELAREDAGPWNVHAKLSLENLVFQSKDGRKMGENISLETTIEGFVDVEHARMTLTLSLQAADGEALYNRHYLNLQRNPIIASCNGFYHLQEKYLQISRLRFDIPGILPLEIQGLFNKDPSKGDTDFTVTIPQASLKPIFQHLLKEPYKTEKPAIATLETEGTVSAEFRIKRLQDAWHVTGRLEWHDGKLFSEAKDISLKGIHLDLPIWYRNPLVENPAETLKGKLEVQSVSVSLLPEQSLNIPLAIGPNRISVESPTVIRIPGGDLRLGSVHIKELFGPELDIQTSLAFDGVKLQPLLSKIWTHELEGTLTGKLNPIRYKRHVATSHGNITAEVFGGKIVFSHLGAAGIFTSAPVLKVNAQGDDLLLSKITTDTSFGNIEGVLQGHIVDFEMAYGQPQRFDLKLETIRKKEIPQRISVKAIENIAQIGGQQNPFMGLAGAFTSFFKKLPYEKIGIRAYLENDVFTINGTIKEDGKEYFVKRGGLSGVNIVNHNPDNQISFKDMVKRINRISHKGGSAVK